MSSSQLFARLRRLCGRALFASLLGVVGAQTAFADPQEGGDPAGRVGRIAWLAGEVTLSRPQTGESYPVSVNQPLTSGDVLRTERGGRAEIQIGSVTLRLDAQSELALMQIDDEQIRLQLAGGGVIARLPSRETFADFALSTRDGRFFPLATGLYRVDTDARSTLATTYEGSLQAESGRNMVNVEPGQAAQFWDADGTSQGPAYRLLAAANDVFQQWSAERDRQSYGTQALAPYARYVSPEMTGAADLDTYGDWSETPEYGAIWQPRRVAPNWAPYRDGRWAWVEPWGWNWVGHEPWGFAPFHYGRWVRYGGAWAWVPGERVRRPVYSPAMVAWASAPGVSLSFSIRDRPERGWSPLAPREIYVPVRRSSPRYVREINGNQDRRDGRESMQKQRHEAWQERQERRLEPRSRALAPRQAPPVTAVVVPASPTPVTRPPREVRGTRPGYEGGMGIERRSTEASESPIHRALGRRVDSGRGEAAREAGSGSPHRRPDRRWPQE